MLLWQQYINAIMFGLISFWWGRVQVRHFIQTKKWGGSIGWLIAGVSVMSIGILMNLIVGAGINYCMAIGWAYVPGCATFPSHIRPLQSINWWVIFIGACLVLRPTIRGRDWWIVLTMVILALSIGGFIYWRIGGFDLIYM